MKVVVISASPRKIGKTQVLMKFITEYVNELMLDVERSLEVEFINLSDGGIDYYTGGGDLSDTTKRAIKNITEADVWLVGTPIYNSFFSSALKNLFEYIDYKKTAGNSGFTDVQTLLTQLMSYFNVITNPHAVFITADAIENNQLVDEEVKIRLKQLVDQTLDIALKISN